MTALKTLFSTGRESFSFVIAGFACLGWALIYILERYALALPIHGFEVLEFVLLFFALAFQIWFVTWQLHVSKLTKVLTSIIVMHQPLMGLFCPELARVFFSLIGLLGLLFWIRSFPKCGLRPFFILTLGLVALLIYFAWFNSLRKNHADIYMISYQQELANSGVLHSDVFYSASVTSMIKHYQVPTSGVDGVKAISGHVLVNYWLAACALTYDLPVLLVQGLSKLLVMVPLLIFGIFNFALFRNTKSSVNAIMLFVFFSLLIKDLYVDWISFYLSETFCFAAILLLLAFPLLFLKDSSTSKTKGYIVLKIALLATLAGLCFGYKPHVGIFLCALLALLIMLEISSWRIRALLLALGFVGLGIGIELFLTDSVVEVLKTFKPFNAQITWPELSIIYIYSLLAIFLCSRCSESTYRDRDLTFLIGSVLVAGGFVILYGDANAHYFGYCSFLVALVLIAGSSEALDRLKNIFRGRIFSFKNLILLALIIYVGSVGATTLRKWSLRHKFRLNHVISHVKGEHSQFVSNIKSALEPHLLADRRSLIYFSPQQELLWFLAKKCESKALFFPAVFEVPRIKGAPLPELCEANKNQYMYSMHYFPNAKVENMSPEQLCAQALEDNFNTVIELSAETISDIDLDIYHCS